MAIFDVAFEKTIAFEGGYILRNNPDDHGGQTYAGISRRAWPDWPGWQLVDAGSTSGQRIEAMVYDFYRQHFWNSIRGDGINYQGIADAIFDFAVNAGVQTSVRITQGIVGAKQDGFVGPETLRKIDDFVIEWRSERLFILEFSLSKVSHYKNACLHDKRRHDNKIVSNLKFLCGWINRIEKGAA